MVKDKPKCIHNLFCIPKAGGGLLGIVDCSKPLGHSVHNYVDEISRKFSYRGIYDLICVNLTS